MPIPAYCAICRKNKDKCVVGKVEIHGDRIRIGLCVECIDLLSTKAHNEPPRPDPRIANEFGLHNVSDEEVEAWQTATWDSD